MRAAHSVADTVRVPVRWDEKAAQYVRVPRGTPGATNLERNVRVRVCDCLARAERATGERAVAFLGAGIHSCAYRTASGRCLKITTDPSTVKHARYFEARRERGADLRRIARTYSWVELPPCPFDPDDPQWALVQESVGPTVSEFRSRPARHPVLSGFSSPIAPLSTEREFEGRISRGKSETREVRRAYAEAGITYNGDAHSGNFAVRARRDVVLIDFGHLEVDPPKEGPGLKRFARLRKELGATLRTSG